MSSQVVVMVFFIGCGFFSGHYSFSDHGIVYRLGIYSGHVIFSDWGIFSFHGIS